MVNDRSGPDLFSGVAFTGLLLVSAPTTDYLRRPQTKTNSNCSKNNTGGRCGDKEESANLSFGAQAKRALNDTTRREEGVPH